MKCSAAPSLTSPMPRNGTAVPKTSGEGWNAVPFPPPVPSGRNWHPTFSASVHSLLRAMAACCRNAADRRHVESCSAFALTNVCTRLDPLRMRPPAAPRGSILHRRSRARHLRHHDWRRRRQSGGAPQGRNPGFNLGEFYGPLQPGFCELWTGRYPRQRAVPKRGQGVREPDRLQGRQ